MKTEIFALCDSAADYNGKLCILGTFDTLGAAQVPFVHPTCALAIRIRILAAEQGAHTFRISLIDSDGGIVAGPIEGNFTFQLPPGAATGAINLVINLLGTSFQKMGTHQIDLVVDGQALASLPVYVCKAP
jgi:hypothetical protein